MNKPKHLIIYSHGFGVRKDDRGLFTDIAAALPGYDHLMFDYNQVDEAMGNLTVASLNEQAEHLRQVTAETKQNHPDATIDLICHSQGCVVAALANPEGIRKAIFTAPPAQLSIDSMLQLFKDRPGSDINLQGVSRLKRADFSTTNVPAVYWQSIEIDPIAHYNEFAKTVQLVLINATEDEIIGSQDFSELSSGIEVIEIATGHNFEGVTRQQLLTAITKELPKP
ncbi:MAG TPA: hypothetical protein VGS08_00350 [Candidatus Saccharimonadales bacterium]|nr:hypothetical protein [Candidatus Saccharimonadales bacterium]